MKHKDIEELASEIVENLMAPKGKQTKVSKRRANKYRRPKVIICSGDDILEQLGTAKACSPFPP